MKTLITSLLFCLLTATSVTATVPASETIRQSFSCNGSNTEFTFTIPCYSSSDVYVYTHIIATGVEEELTESSQYTIAATDSDYLNGGVVTTVATYASTYRIVIVRNIQKTQELLRAQMSAAAAIEAVGKLTRIVQDLQDRFNRSIHLQESDGSFDMELPGLALRASTYYGFGTDGAPLLTKSVVSDNTVVSTFMETVVDDPNPAAAMRTLQGVSVVNVASYAISGIGTSGDPWVGALAAAYADNGIGVTYFMPQGHYQDTSTADLNGTGYINIIGAGRRSTYVHYEEIDGSSCWKLHNSGSAVAHVTIRGITFDGNNTATGAMLELEDIIRSTVDDILIIDHKGANTSTGIWTKGRDSLRLMNIETWSTIGIHIDVNPNHATIDADSFYLENIYILPGDKTNGIGVKISAGALFNFHTGGANNVAGGAYGIYWNNSESTASPINVCFSNWRIEQGNSTGDWGFYLASNNGQDVIGLRLVNFHASEMSGFYLRDVTQPMLVNCVMTSGSGYTSLDIDDDGALKNFQIQNTYLNPAATFSIPATFGQALGHGDDGAGYYNFYLYDSTKSIKATIRHGVTSGITASTTQSQLQGQFDNNKYQDVGTVANTNDVVTLPSVRIGDECIVYNGGAETLQIFPFTNDTLGAGANNSTTLAAGSYARFYGLNGTAWRQEFTPRSVRLLSITTVALNANAETTIYTVPTGYRCVLHHAVLVAGADAGTSDISIGQNGAETDFVPATDLANVDAQYDACILEPIMLTASVPKIESYAAATVIRATVTNQAGGATNTLYLYGFLH